MKNTIACSRCGLVVVEFSYKRHYKSARCNARHLARQLEAQGLVACTTISSVQYVEAALKLFGFECRREMTKTETAVMKTPIRASQCWTTPEGAALANVIDHTSGFIHCTFPAAAKRLHEHQHLIPQLITISALGGTTPKALYRLLRPIDYKEEISGKRTYRWAENNWRETKW